jgi:hypothetical protein
LEIRECVVRALKQAASDLRVEVITPYSVSSGGVSHECLAFLPEFGSKKGMVVEGIEPPDFAISNELKNAAKEQGLYCSFINMDPYRSYNPDSFIRMLSDWGYYGSESTKPNWLVDPAGQH